MIAPMRNLLVLALAAHAVVSAQRVSPYGRAEIEVVRVPNGGVQPELAVDRTGAAHIVYLAGEPGAANVFYVRTSDGGKTLTQPLRVNSQEGSAIATGTIRGAHIAISRSGRIHVAWNGSSTALPKPPANPKTERTGMPMLYTRSNTARTGFEPQRNLMTQTINLDGGGSITADAEDDVFVAWHANALNAEDGEAVRRVWIARSMNDGETFSTEYAVSDPSTGVCGCCALRVAVTRPGELQMLYRSATATVNRDIYSLVSKDRGRTFVGSRTHEWEIGACPMTSMSIVGGTPTLRAWETDGQVYFTIGNDASPKSPSLSATGQPPRRKHPRLAATKEGTVLLVWAEGTAWARGGSIAWQLFDRAGQPIGSAGSAEGLPVWSFPAVFARRDESFAILY